MKGLVSVVCLVAISIAGCSTVPTDQGVDVPLDASTAISDSDVAVLEVPEEKVFSNDNDVDIPNAMVKGDKQDIKATISPQTISQESHEGREQVARDANLIAANIKSGITIYGVTGDSKLVDTTSGNADAGTILSGRIAWVDGQEISGLLEVTSCSDMPNCSGNNGSCVFLYDDCARETEVFESWAEVLDGLRYNKNAARITYGWCAGRAECCRAIR